MPAAVLRHVLTVDPPPALRLRDVDIAGPVDLQGVSFAGELALHGCRIYGGDIDLSRSQFGALSLAGLIVRGSLLMDSVDVGRSVVLDGAVVDDRTAAVHASIAGRLSLAGARLGLDLEASELALDLYGARVGGQLLAGRIATGAEVGLKGLRTGGAIDFVDADLRGTPVALSMDNARIEGAAMVNSSKAYGRFEAKGAVTMDGAQVAGQLNFTGATLGGLEARNVDVGGEFFLNHGTVNGTVFLTAAKIAGQLNATGGKFRADNSGAAIDAEGVRVGTNVWLNHGFEADGRVNLRHLAAGGHVNAVASCVDGGGGVALNLERARIGTDLVLADAEWAERGFEAFGTVVLRNASVGGGLDATGGHFDGRGSDALQAERVAVGTDLTLAAVAGTATSRGYRFEADGPVRLRGASAGGSLTCTGGSFSSDAATGPALDVASVSVGDTLSLLSLGVNGEVDLSSARCARLADDSSYWTADGGDANTLDLDGCVYTVLARPDKDKTWTSTKKWLDAMPTYRPQPYLQLAAVMQAGGEERYARKLNIERHKQRLSAATTDPPAGAARVFSWAARQFDRLLGVTIGFGYAPWRALLWALALVAVGWAIYAPASASDLMRPSHTPGQRGAPSAKSSHCTPSYPCLHPLIYSVDTVLPIIRLGERDNWFVDTRTTKGELVAIYSWLATLLGWVLATFVVASFSNAVRRE